MKKQNIDAIINANGLAKKLVTALPGAENQSLLELRKADLKFEKYLASDSEREDSNSYVGRKFIDFIHEGREDAYKKPEFSGDYSRKSLNDCAVNLNRDSEKIGNCLGICQFGAYLFLKRGIPVQILKQKNHVLLEIEDNDLKIPIETTTRDGFNYFGEKETKKEDVNNLLPILLYNLGACVEKQGKSHEAVKYNTKSINLRPTFPEAYNNRGFSWDELEEYEKAIEDYTEAIKLNSDHSNAYYNRGLAWKRLGEHEKARADFRRASFLEEKNSQK